MLADIVNKLRGYVTSVTKEVDGITTQYDLVGRFKTSPVIIEDGYSGSVYAKKEITFYGRVIAFQDDLPTGPANKFDGEDIVAKVLEIAKELTKLSAGKYEIDNKRIPPFIKADVCIGTAAFPLDSYLSPKQARSEEAAIRRNFKGLLIHTTFGFSDELLDDTFLEEDDS